MPAAQYTYSDDSNASRLDEQILASSFGDTKYNGLVLDSSTTPATVTVHTTSELSSGEETELDGIVAAHNPAVLSTEQRVEAARVFGGNLIESWQRTFLDEGVVQAGSSHLLSTTLYRAEEMSRLGNLYSLDAELAVIAPVPTFLEAARITIIRNTIRAYLGLAPV